MISASTEFGIGGPWLAEYTLAALGAGIVMFDAGGCVSQWNQAAAPLLGVTEQQLAGRSLDDPALLLTDKARRPLTRSSDPVRFVLTSGEPVFDVRIGTSNEDGEECWRTFNLLPVFGVERTPRGVLASIVRASISTDDVWPSDRWHDVAQSMFSDSLTANLVVDRSGAIIEWNDAALTLSGRIDVDMIGSHLCDVCDIDLEWVWEGVQESGGGSLEGLTYVMQSLGSEVAVLSRFSLTTWPNVGDVVLVQLLDPAWSESSAPSRNTAVESRLFQHVRIPLLLVTDNGVIVGANPSALELFVDTPSGFVGQTVFDRIAGLGVEQLRSRIAQARMTLATEAIGTFLTRAAGRVDTEIDVSVTAIDVSDAPSPYVLMQLTELSGAGVGAPCTARHRRHGSA